MFDGPSVRGMVSVSVSSAQPTTVRADVLILGIRNDEDRAGFADHLESLRFTGKKGQVKTFLSGGTSRAPVVAAVGLPAEPSGEDLRRAAARAVRAVAEYQHVAVALHPSSIDEVEAIAEGIQMGAYRFDAYKTAEDDDDQTRVTSASILTAFSRQTRTARALDRAAVVSDAVCQARDWVNTPPGDLQPSDFARQITEEAGDKAEGRLDVSVWDEKRLAKERCGGMLGVGAGSVRPPRMVRMTYRPENPRAHIALVGKGITFDSGGLSIKPGSSMMTMKCDMGGAAAVAAATIAIARLELPVSVTAFMCLAENMPSGSATRPGDVLTMRNGKTVEVHNTDAEGRLVLADGLSLASEAEPDVIVDAATLTGACVVALGDRTAGILSDHDDVREELVRAAANSGESMWPLPIVEEMHEKVHSSTIADLRQHNPKPAGGTLFAAAFLREFAGDIPWGHLDIAGPAFNDNSAWDYTPAGGTGVGVRTLVRLARDRSES